MDTIRIPSFSDAKAYLQLTDVVCLETVRVVFQPQADLAQQSNFQLLSERSLASAPPPEVLKGQTHPAKYTSLKEVALESPPRAFLSHNFWE